MMEIVSPSIILIEYTRGAENHIELCGREAYGSAVSMKIEDTRDWIRKRIAQGEEDVVEHAVATWHIVCSRAVSHELVRHRLASYTQMSQRFTEKATENFIIPAEVEEVDRPAWEAIYFLEKAFYEEQRRKYPRQTARYVLPVGTATSLYATWNFRVIRHVIKLRVVPAAQPEFRVLAGRLRNICVENWPGVFGDLVEEVTN